MHIFRTFLLIASCFAYSFLVEPHIAYAEDDRSKPIELSDLNLPSEDDIEKIIKDMPDFNKLINGMVKIAKDEDIRTSLKQTAEDFSNSVEKSGLKDIGDNLEDGELPDFNKLFETMLRLTTDKKVMNDMVDIVNELQQSIEDNIDDDILKDKSK